MNTFIVFLIGVLELEDHAQDYNIACHSLIKVTNQLVEKWFAKGKFVDVTACECNHNCVQAEEEGRDKGR